MLGKLVGKVVGETLSLPFTVMTEAAKAIDVAAETIEKRVDEAVDPKSDTVR